MSSCSVEVCDGLLIKSEEFKEEFKKEIEAKLK